MEKSEGKGREKNVTTGGVRKTGICAMTQYRAGTKDSCVSHIVQVFLRGTEEIPVEPPKHWDFMLCRALRLCALGVMATRWHWLS